MEGGVPYPDDSSDSETLVNEPQSVFPRSIRVHHPSLPARTIPSWDDDDALPFAEIPEPPDVSPWTPNDPLPEAFGEGPQGPPDPVYPAHIWWGTLPSEEDGLVAERIFSHDASDDPFNPNGDDYEWPILSPRDREIFSPARTAAWLVRRVDVETRTTNPPLPRSTMDNWLAIASGDPIESGGMVENIQARLESNRDRHLYPANPGPRVYGLRPRTAEEQSNLELILLDLAADHEEYRAQGRGEEFN